MATIVSARPGLGRFRFSSKRENIPFLYRTAFADAKPLRTFAGNALAPAGAI
ncbi:MAG: hypothetical protein J0I23_15820 [Rhizobiales bacterium]|nr:hypothetical protein [Hyphomicrobiales bacterium]